MAASLSHRRVIIVGAGQAGLAVAAALISEGLQPQQDFVVIDADAQGRRSWDTRWHSMVLLSNARHCALPPRWFPGDQRRHPRVDEIADYLTYVESSLGVEPSWGIRASAVEHRGSGATLHLTTTAGEVQTRNVVCATGAAAYPRIPDWAIKLKVSGVSMHSSEYLYPRQIPDGDVLIVGGGNSGVQLAQEISASNPVTLAVRTPRRHLPANLFPWATGETMTLLTGKSRPEPVFGAGYSQLHRRGVTIRPAVTDADGDTVTFADGTQAHPATVIFATGFTAADDWLPDEARSNRPKRTLTGIPGLFVAGMPTYSRRGADTIPGAWSDARTIAQHIVNRP